MKSVRDGGPALTPSERSGLLNVRAAQPAKAQPKRATDLSRRIRILIAGEHPFAREGLRALLAAQSDLLVVGGASDITEIVQLVADLKPDILMLDLSVSGHSALDVMRELNDRSHRVVGTAAANSSVELSCRTIIVAPAVEKGHVANLLRLGVRGLVPARSPTELIFKCIRKVHDGELWVGRTMLADVFSVLAASSEENVQRLNSDFGLTPREREILRHIVAGHSNKAIADRLSVGEDTVKHHLTNIFDKTGASNRLELAVFALHHRLLESE